MPLSLVQILLFFSIVILQVGNENIERFVLIFQFSYRIKREHSPPAVIGISISNPNKQL